ncbi:MAG: twin-arginine translocation signal domain-containing protein [Blastocatellia bacterium]|nr:twin-arginine translocation signal domain-containing protein [Blastocatellia bacterium]MCS7157973.1 twin-arginine translocation signal domain-containing protein [Blastocatellia bacterium]MCX7752480.1 twin-arginine translocation signal domain-containing protein [Blastocatellia bacterium]MDW8167405.1 twin-arginine translocation signal domain-containing protein [Acidobacteriota bacterium]MDW8257417.1 twin-arginine translocation signal domain-containing protein [Acidobacteriota bacterium]
MNKKRGATRRQFLKTVAATAVLPSTFPLLEEAEKREDAVSVTTQATQQPLTPSAAAEALGELVRVRYGRFLTEEQLAEVKRQIERGLRSAERLRNFPLTNADEPDLIFRAVP